MTSDSGLPPRPEALARIDHVVVLMLENRSFDNLLGWLYDGEQPRDGQPFEGLHCDMWNPLANSNDGVPFTEQVFVRKNGEPGRGRRWTGKSRSDANFALPDPDPGEGFRATNHQLFGFYDVANDRTPEPSMDGFVNDYQANMLSSAYIYGDDPTDPREIMTAFTPEQTPVLSKLAREFAVCDHWYASVPSQTFPNRDFVHAATSDGHVTNTPRTCGAATIFNRIEDRASRAAATGSGEIPTWGVYSGTEGTAWFSLTRLVMQRTHGRFRHGGFHSIDTFADDVRAARLPSYSFLEPQFTGAHEDDQKPPSDIRPGEDLIGWVYETLRDSPLWERTLLVITYDEHGGCFDHVAPPAGATPPHRGAPAGDQGFRFDRFGVRVPAVLVSPWIEAGTVARPAGSTPFDHTSVLATVHQRFGTDHLTERDKAAPDLSCVLTRETPRTDRVEVERPDPLVLAAIESETTGPVHALVLDIAEALAELTGRAVDHGDVHGFVHTAYADHFERSGQEE